MITMDIFLNMILRPLVTETMHYLNKHLTAFSGTTKHHFTAKQCEALEIALDVIKVHNSHSLCTTTSCNLL